MNELESVLKSVARTSAGVSAIEALGASQFRELIAITVQAHTALRGAEAEEAMLG